MKRAMVAVVVTAAVVMLVGEGLAQMGPMHGRGAGMGRGMGMMGGGQAAGWECPLAGGSSTEALPVTEERARELATEYAEKYLKGFTVERVLPFSAPRGTAYSVELKGPEGQTRTFHVNPWGDVMPFGGPGRRAG